MEYQVTQNPEFLLSETVLETLFGTILVILLITLVLGIIVLIAQVKAYKKAGEEGWKAIIPVYNQYTLCNIVGINPMWILIVVLSSFLSSIPLIGLVSSIASIYFTVLLNVSVAKSYGKSTAFAIGLIFLPFIFWPIIGFGKANYIGKNPMQDLIFKNYNNNQTTTQTPNPTPNQNQNINEQISNLEEEKAISYCTNCGQAFYENTSAFCSNCGAKRG